MIRNKAFFCEIALSSGILAFFTVLSRFFPSCILLPLSGALIIAVHILYTQKRYNAIKRLSDELTDILHGCKSRLTFSTDEGELSILETEIAKMTQRLNENAEKLSKDKLFLSSAISDISHQLRTPLTAINLTMSLFSAEQLSDEKRLSLTRDLMRSLRKIEWLIDSLLKLSRLDAGTIVFASDVISVRSIYEKAIAPLEIFLEIRGVSAETEIASETLTGDLNWLSEALCNLIRNCAQHTPAGGVISIAANETPLFTEITVSDTGGGFEKEDLPHLFERFYKGKNASEDSIGIGLALSKNIITALGGTIRAVNTEKGARFIIRFYKTTV